MPLRCRSQKCVSKWKTNFKIPGSESRVFFCPFTNRLKRKGRCVLRKAQQRQKGHPVGLVSGIGIGVGVGLLLTLIISAISAWLINGERLPQNAIGTVAVLTQCVAAFAGCLAAILLAGNMPAIVAPITAGVYFVFLVCTNILFMNSELAGAGKGFIAILIGALLAVGARMLSKGKKKHKLPKIR